MNAKKPKPYSRQIMMFCGFPIGVRAEPTFAAIAESVTALALSIPESSERATTRGMKTSIAVSFIISAEERAIVGSRRRSSLLLEPFVRSTSLGASLLKTPESSRPFEVMIKAVMRLRLPQSTRPGVLPGRERSTRTNPA
ncbi:hypothetical protein BD01_0659 [Thermococcus nautili]|uniref:Uncharacterized protein n=1 Tax=Thermococcus nautili TaxID=195522 RepID=W8NT50_9EURY|nr:hypothetical protein BD01_0659 [Thermococcus nautili]